MNILRLLYYIPARRYYRRALEDISPLHPDVPKIRLRQVEVDDALKKLLAQCSAT